MLNANYIRVRLQDHYKVAINQINMHECVFDGLLDKSTHVTTLDVAKRLIDYGYHPPTIYFPLIVHEALMVEPTETEKLETMDEFIDAMIKIAEEAKTDPELVKSAPNNTALTRLDEVKAARTPVLKWTK